MFPPRMTAANDDANDEPIIMPRNSVQMRPGDIEKVKLRAPFG